MVGDPQRFNLYAYVRNSPLISIDPTGEAIQLLGNEADRKKELAILQQAVGEQAGTYLYDNAVTTKNADGTTTTEHFVGILANGPDGKGPSFDSINKVSHTLGQIVGAQQIAQIQIVLQGSRIEGHRVAPIHNVPILGNVGGTPAITVGGRISILDPGIEPGRLSAGEMSNGQPGTLDWGIIVMHELGHATSNWSAGGVYETSNEKAIALENQVRNSKDSAEPTRISH